MEVETAEPWRVENAFRQQEPVGHDDSGIDMKILEGALLLLAPEGLGRSDINSMRRGKRRDGRRFGGKTTPLWTRRLGVDRAQIMLVLDQCSERWHGKVGRTHEGETEGHGIICEAAGFEQHKGTKSMKIFMKVNR